MLRVLCCVCCEKEDYSENGMPFIVKSGDIRVRVYLCDKHAAEADDAERAPLELTWEVPKDSPSKDANVKEEDG